MIDPDTGLEVPDDEVQRDAEQRALAADALANLNTTPAPEAATPPELPSPNPGDYAQSDLIAPPASDAATPLDVSPAATARLGTPPELDVGEPPPPPLLTGDPAKDVQSNALYQRSLTDYAAKVKTAHGFVSKQAADVQSRKAERERDAAADIERRQFEETQRRNAERKVQQAAIDREVGNRVQRERETGRSWWADRSTPQKIEAIAAGALGGIGAAFQNAAAAQLGQVGHAQNEALATIHKIMDKDYADKRDRLEAAGKSVLEARYGMKDSEEIHRAMSNDLDADRAAKYRHIAAEAEADLRARGADDAAIAANQDIADLRAKAAAAEGSILEREAKRQLDEKHYRAEEKLADANLSIARGGLALRRDEAGIRHDEFQQREQDRRDAAAEKDNAKKAAQQDKDEKEIARGEHNEPIGRVPTGRGGAQGFSTRDADYARALEQLEALKKDIEAHGDRTKTPDAQRRRTTLYHDAIIGVATVSPLGKTNEAMEAEAGSLGSSGAGFGGTFFGANPDAVQRKIDQLKTQRDRYRQETLSPLTPEEAERHRKGGATVPSASAAQPAGKPAAMQIGNVVYHLQADGTYK